MMVKYYTNLKRTEIYKEYIEKLLRMEMHINVIEQEDLDALRAAQEGKQTPI